MGELTALPNIGKELKRQLQQAGIDNAAQLRQMGACLHRLYALEGAVEGIKKTQLSPERKPS